MKPAKKQLLAVSCSTELLAAIDQIAAREMRSRSDVVRQAMLRELEAKGICLMPAMVAA